MTGLTYLHRYMLHWDSEGTCCMCLMVCFQTAHWLNKWLANWTVLLHLQPKVRKCILQSVAVYCWRLVYDKIMKLTKRGQVEKPAELAIAHFVPHVLDGILCKPDPPRCLPGLPSRRMQEACAEQVCMGISFVKHTVRK